MRKFFLIPLVALFTCVNVWADAIATVEGGGLESAQTADDLTELNEIINGLNGTPATVTLLADIEGEEGDENNVTFFVPNGKDVTLNLNGHGIIQHWAMQTVTSHDCSGYEYTDKAPAEFKEANPDPNALTGDALMMAQFMGYLKTLCIYDIDKNSLIYNEGTLTIVSEGSSIVQIQCSGSGSQATTICNAGTLIINGGIFIGPQGEAELPKLPVIWAKQSSSHITINGGTFLCYEGYSDYNKGADLGPITGGGTWVIKGGIFSTDEMVGTWLTSHKSTKDYFLSERGGVDYSPAPGYKAIEVPYTNANIQEYTRAWRISESNGKRVIDQADSDQPVTPGNEVTEYFGSESDDRAKGVHQHYRYAIKPVCMVIPDDEGTDNFLYVEPSVTMTIQEGETLHVGTHGIAFANPTTSRIVVEPGATLLSEGDIISSSGANIELTMDARNDKYSTLALKAGTIQAKHPNATVTLKSVCNYDGSAYHWQRFAVPTYEGNVNVGSFAAPTEDYKTAVYRFDYEDANDWAKMANEETLKPFVGYMMTINGDFQADYTFQCELVGKGNPEVYVYKGWNFLANSYTAPMSITAILEDFIGRTDGSDDAALWVQRAPGSADWKSATYADVFLHKQFHIGTALGNLNPMQAFLVNRLTEGGILELNYADYVSEIYFPTPAALGAPARRAPQLYEDITFAYINVEASNSQKETVIAYLSDDFTDGNDPGFDTEKIMNKESFDLYFVSPALEKNLERIATNNLDNTSISLKTKEAENYTMTFDNVTLEGYSIIDNVTKTETEIKAGNVYEFTAAANSTHEGRFSIINSGSETAIDNVEATHITNGIYSITGIYMGTNFNVLPAGVYVVNGKKVVK